MGGKQEKWLKKQLRKSDARWNVLAQQVMMAKVDRDPGEGKRFSVDQWPGYDISNTQKISHSNWVNELKVDYDRLEEKTVAVEFVGTSITSGGDGSLTVDSHEEMMRQNPFLKFHSRERGYVSCTVSPSEWRSDYQAVEYVSKQGAPLITRASFVVENGQKAVEKA